MNKIRKNLKSKYSRIGVALSFLLLPLASPATNIVRSIQPTVTTNIHATLTNETEFYFEASLTDGSKLLFPFSEQPTLRNQGSDLVLTTTKEEINLPNGSVEKFCIIKGDDTTGIEKLFSKAKIERNGNTVYVSNCKPDSEISVYDLSGKKVILSRTDSNGECSISLEHLSKGVYVVKSESVTFKILKK